MIVLTPKYKYSASSLSKLEGVDQQLVDLAHEVLCHHDATVIYGLRTLEEQKRLFKAKLSKTMNSRHLTGHAIDLAPYPIDWNDIKRFYYFANCVLTCARYMGITIRWGGDWDSDNDLNDQKFMDLVHFEKPFGAESI